MNTSEQCQALARRPEWQLALPGKIIAPLPCQDNAQNANRPDADARSRLLNISDIFETISDYDPERVYQRLSKKCAGTTTWICDEPKFRSWATSEFPACFWLCGISK